MDKNINLRYNTIQELIEDVEKLGDWKDPAQKDAYFLILAKLTVIQNGYRFEDELGTVNGYYPPYVTKAICKICSQKFPADDVPFDEDGRLKPGFPDYSNYLVLPTTGLGLSILAERTNIYKITEEKFNVSLHGVPATKEQVLSFMESCKNYLEMENENQNQPK